MSSEVKQLSSLDRVTIRFAGDSGDGIQVTGSQYATSSAVAGNDLSTLPDFPAEIRAPAGSLAGVSGFQLQFSSSEIYTPGDRPDVLVAMNPAALQRNYREVAPNGIIIVDTAGFNPKNLQRAGFETNPLEGETLTGWRVFAVDITELTKEALKETELSNKEVVRCKNFFALGLMFWLYNRPMEPTLRWLAEKYAKKPIFIEANQRALRAGYNYGVTTDSFQVQYEVAPAAIAPGTYRKINGNQAMALGLIVGAQKAELDLIYGTYPITPASDILHELAKHKRFGVKTVQCEDEIAAVGLAIGASYGGQLGVTGSSGPGVALKGEALGLAVMVELPLVVCDIQRGGPSTGLPTKTEQSDLLQVLFGRNGECPMPVLAAATPGDCFTMAVEAVRIATRYMTPVFLLSDGYIANGAEPWLVPDVSAIPAFPVRFRTETADFAAYARDEKLARSWVRPGTPGLEHRIGGLEKQDVTGHVSYDPVNHQRMTNLRAAKVAGIAKELPPSEVFGPEQGDLLVVGWGSTYGPIRAAVASAQAQGRSVAHLHIRYLNPMPEDVPAIIGRYRRVLIPEMNMGQLAFVLRGLYGVEAVRLNKVQGQPFKVSEILESIQQLTMPAYSGAAVEATL
jgi:2-oxoglutarate ferredoxin oxidoreductase subunit alpha